MQCMQFSLRGLFLLVTASALLFLHIRLFGCVGPFIFMGMLVFVAILSVAGAQATARPVNWDGKPNEARESKHAPE